MAGIDYAQEAAGIVRDAGGSIVGRTRLQKIGYFLEAVGLGAGFPFLYKHYGPYSELLAGAIQEADALRLISETEMVANWGGLYSIFDSKLPPEGSVDPARKQLAQEMVKADAVELELAATAAFLAHEGVIDPWRETERRKPEKAKGRLEGAKQLYQRLQGIPTPQPLPNI
jgi:uncharacterized protein